jgi:F-type H+-transporting ATPase subunit a
MSEAESLTPTSYINHHLSFFQQPVRDGNFWMLHTDTLVVSVLLGMLAFGFLWWVVRGATSGVPTKRQAFVELTMTFVDDQVKGIFHGDRHAFVAPLALTVFVWVLLMNAMDFLPVDIMAWIYLPLAQMAQRADRRRQYDLRAGPVGLADDDLLRHQGEGHQRLGA